MWRNTFGYETQNYNGVESGSIVVKGRHRSDQVIPASSRNEKNERFVENLEISLGNIEHVRYSINKNYEEVVF